MNNAETKITITAQDNASEDLRHIQGLMRELGALSDDAGDALTRLGAQSAGLGAALSEMDDHLPVERLRETVLLMEQLGVAGQPGEGGAASTGASPATMAGGLGNVFYITINALDARDVEQFFRERLEPYLQQRSRDGYDVIWADGLRQVS